MSDSDPAAECGAGPTPVDAAASRRPYEPPVFTKRRSLADVTLFSGGGAAASSVATMGPTPPSMGPPPSL